MRAFRLQLAVVAGLSVVALLWLPLPVVWISLAWAVVCAQCIPRSRRRFLWFNVVLVLLALAAIETALAARPRAWHWGDYENAAYFDPHPDLGFVARPNQRATHQKHLGPEQLYAVAYTIDEQGLRRSNPPDKPRGGPCVLFFGGSFTFGEGLDDEETLAYRISRNRDLGLRTRNFGFHGYGPHHMLAMIQNGRVANSVDCDPRWAVYLSIHDHVFRAAGLRWWDRSGPRYALGPGGEPQRRGQFDDGHGLADKVLRFLQKRSEIAKRLRDRTRALSDRDYELYFALVRAARERLETLYPGIRSVVIQWDLGEAGSADLRMQAGLEELGFEVERLSTILERAGEAAEGLTIPGDGHPNARANEILAEHLRWRLGRGIENTGGAG